MLRAIGHEWENIRAYQSTLDALQAEADHVDESQSVRVRDLMIRFAELRAQVERSDERAIKLGNVKCER